jgi:hypothetical protein
MKKQRGDVDGFTALIVVMVLSVAISGILNTYIESMEKIKLAEIAAKGVPCQTTK